MVSPLLICKSISSLRVPFLLAHALDHINPLTMQRAEMTQVQTFPASSKSDILMNIKNVLSKQEVHTSHQKFGNTSAVKICRVNQHTGRKFAFFVKCWIMYDLCETMCHHMGILQYGSFALCCKINPLSSYETTSLCSKMIPSSHTYKVQLISSSRN